jgi:O-antigen/teichoic acid export membrane protein
MTSDRANLGGAARKGVRWTSIGAIGATILQLLQLVVLARFLEPADFGRMAILLVILAIGSIFAELGLSAAIIQRPHVEKHELGTLLVVNLIAGTASFALIWLTAPLMSAFVNAGDMSRLIQGAGLVFLITPWGLQVRALMQKQLHFGLLAKINLFAAATGTAVAIALAVLDCGVWALLGGYLATQSAGTLMLVLVGMRRGLWAGFAWRPSAVRSYLVFGGYRLAAMLANSLNSRIDQLVIGKILGAAPLGFYNVSGRLTVEPVQKLNPVVTRVAIPIFSLIQDEDERLRRWYLRMNMLLLAIMTPLLLGLAATAHVAVPAVLGSDWEPIVPVLRVLALYSIVRCIGNAGGSVMIAKGRADWSFFWNAAKLFVVPLAIWWTATRTGDLRSIAFALLSIEVLLMIVHYFVILRRLVRPCGPAYLASIFRPTFTAAGMALLVWQFDRLLTGFGSAERLSMLIAAGAVSYLTLSLIFQREFVREALLVFGRGKWSVGTSPTASQ